MIGTKFTSIIAFFVTGILLGVYGFSGPTGPKEMTVSRLMEQYRGDAIHWDGEGKTPGFWDITHRHYYKVACKKFAIQELGRRGSASKEAVPELIRMFQEHADWDSGDGIVNERSDIARTLGAIDDPTAIAPMINLIREKSSTPDGNSGRGPIRWHVKSSPGNYGYGPDGITDGLKLFSEEHHPEILRQLADLQSELETISLPNKWTEKAVADAMKFFRSRSYVKSGDVEMIKIQYKLAEFE